jgi:hypothetical protein
MKQNLKKPKKFQAGSTEALDTTSQERIAFAVRMKVQVLSLVMEDLAAGR